MRMTLIGSLLKFYGPITRRILLPRNSNRTSSTLEPQRFSRRWWCASLLLTGKPLKLFLSMLLQMPWNWIRSINIISPSLTHHACFLYISRHIERTLNSQLILFVLQGGIERIVFYQSFLTNTFVTSSWATPVFTSNGLFYCWACLQSLYPSLIHRLRPVIFWGLD